MVLSLKNFSTVIQFQKGFSAMASRILKISNDLDKKVFLSIEW